MVLTGVSRCESALFCSCHEVDQLDDGPRQITVHTPFTSRARELKELYKGLEMTNISVDERLDVLLHVKWTVTEFDCPLTRDVVQLIDREADMLNRGRSEKSLGGLRRRLQNLFLNFLMTPEVRSRPPLLSPRATTGCCQLSQYLAHRRRRRDRDRLRCH
jgi:hypothetical protein